MVLPAAMVAVTAASSVLGAVKSLNATKQAIKQAKQQAALKNLEGDIYESNAAAQANADAYNEDMDRKQRDLELSRLRATAAQSGVSGGTLIDVQMRSEQEAAMDDIVERYNNHSKYMAVMYEAQKARTEAQQLLANAKSMKKNRWLNALIGAVDSGLGAANSSGLVSTIAAQQAAKQKEEQNNGSE